MSTETISGAWPALVQKGTTKAMENLSQMIGQPIEVSSFGLRSIPVGQIVHLVGGPETTAVGIYLTVSGAAEGHLMLLYEPKIACQFVDLLMMQPPNTTVTLGEMEQSALGELGNIVGASFLNVLGDEMQIVLMPSPPTVVLDMAGALLSVVAADLMMTQEEAYVAETSFRAADRDIDGSFFVMPSAALLRALLDWSHAT